MPQEIRVLKCYKCGAFQSDIVKKAKKWSCKLCGEKQSVIQEYGRGSGKECRLHVQKLNAKRGQEQNLINELLENSFKTNEETMSTHPLDELSERSPEMRNDANGSKWIKYVHEEDLDSDYDANDIKLSRPVANKKRTFNHSSKQINQSFGKGQVSVEKKVPQLQDDDCDGNNEKIKRRAISVTLENAVLLCKKNENSIKDHFNITLPQRNDPHTKPAGTLCTNSAKSFCTTKWGKYIKADESDDD